MFSFKYSPRPNTLAEQRLPDDVPEEEKTRRIVALQALQREIQSGAERARWSGATVDVLVDAGEPAARHGAVGPHEQERRREPAGPRDRGSAGLVPVRVERAGPAQRLGPGVRDAAVDEAALDGSEPRVTPCRSR